MFDRWVLLRRVRETGMRLIMGVIPLALLLAVVPALLFLALLACSVIHLPPHWSVSGGVGLSVALLVVAMLAGWLYLLGRKTIFGDLLKHYQIFTELGDSYALKEALVENFDPAYYGEFRFDDNVPPRPHRGETVVWRVSEQSGACTPMPRRVRAGAQCAWCRWRPTCAPARSRRSRGRFPLWMP